MKKINIGYIIATIKDIFTKTCIYFAGMTVITNFIGSFVNVSAFAPSICFIFAWTALIAGIAVQIFKIKKLPSISRHIAFFIILYLDFLLLLFLWIQASRKELIDPYMFNSKNSTLFLSIGFALVYLVILGVFAGIKAIVNAVRNKKLNYEKQFKDAK